MAVNMDYYGDLVEANAYFGLRLHEQAWTRAKPADRPKALVAATQILDGLAFKGDKHSVYVLVEGNSHASQDELRSAEASQPLEFPRGSDTQVPEAIRRACYELAYSLLDGRDPEMELENLAIVSQGYNSVRTTYSRTDVPLEHLINGVPSAAAWRLLRPFLRDEDAIHLSRVS